MPYRRRRKDSLSLTKKKKRQLEFNCEKENQKCSNRPCCVLTVSSPISVRFFTTLMLTLMTVCRLCICPTRWFQTSTTSSRTEEWWALNTMKSECQCSWHHHWVPQERTVNVIYECQIFLYELLVSQRSEWELIDDLRKSRGLHSVRSFGHGPVCMLLLVVQWACGEDNNNNNSYIALYPVKIYKLAALITDTCKQKAEKASEMPIKHSLLGGNMQIG